MTYEEMYKQAEAEDMLEDLMPHFFKWEKEGDMLIGRFLHAFEVESSTNEGTYKQYVVETTKGKMKFSLGSLADRELEGVLEHGRIYAFRYLGKENIGKGRSVNVFQVRQILAE